VSRRFGGVVTIIIAVVNKETTSTVLQNAFVNGAREVSSCSHSCSWYHSGSISPRRLIMVNWYTRDRSLR
jgi:hypothetical protein